jgi:ferredoxin
MPMAAQPVGALERLNERAPIWANMRACLSHRFPRTGCRRCVEVCPASALSMTGTGLVLRDDCIGCGRCVATCPTGALSMPGLDATSAPTQAGTTVSVDCRRVPLRQSPSGALRVPCVGAVRVSDWLALACQAAPQAVEVLDRGACRTCPAGDGEANPAAAAMDEANRWLEHMGAPGTQRIRFVPRPADMPLNDLIPDSAAERNLDRRGFLRALTGHAALAAQGASRKSVSVGTPAIPDGGARIHPTERVALLARLGQIARDHGHTLPAELFHRVSIDAERCCHHGLCARTCPTAALSVYETVGDCGIRFDPALCIGCGECRDICPGHALTLQAATDASLRVRTLTRHETRVCAECHQNFVAGGTQCSDEDLPVCPACEKSRGMMSFAFQQLFHPGDQPAEPHERETLARGERHV